VLSQNDNNLLQEKEFLEGQLTELRKLPFIKVDPNNPLRQKTTPAGKQYKELLQQYINVVKALEKLSINESDTSPLREWLDSHVEH
jgi:hypothetical protein